MLLTPEEALTGFPFFAQRKGLTQPANETAVRNALAMAATLARTDDEEPAAGLYVFATFRRAFPGAWRQMASLLTLGQLRLNGLRLAATAGELDTLCTEVMYRRADFEAVRAWFSPRLQPTAPPWREARTHRGGSASSLPSTHNGDTCDMGRSRDRARLPLRVPSLARAARRAC